ncbi:EF-hand domain-containing protein [Zobellia galactanivorans]|uniref:Putative exported protein n=1 Tax=Zobellia galactanivorans (strain DSM 12802 / CCUG 47099 / CIP 106680 / NCIMB 13871 / Dsij) TaxID=63186 RepID=G0LC73_ZOBGA|nr:EF-hand domain-containing protein [Zobellia galactanivorans]MDO6807052.1 EF-hand domain-containing protein [Zobellia galactanivorans]CAZ96705.1 Putative exported protein [Zobellia galactanivorans]
MKKNVIHNTLALSIFMLMTATVSFAQEKKGQEPPSATEILKQMDKDEDGKLSKEEVKGPLKNDFSKIDTDEDGYLSLDELKKAPKPQRRKKQ